MSSSKSIVDLLSLKGRRAIVSGGSAGIGLGLARALVEAGAHVLITGRRPATLEEAAKVLRAAARDGARVATLVADVTKSEDNGNAVAAAAREFGGLDILVNNAGIYEFAPLSSATADHVARSFNVNVVGLIDLTRQALPELKKSRAGRIVHITSVVAYGGVANGSIYSATKAAVEAFSRALAAELAQDETTRHITTNCIAPGPFATEGFPAEKADYMGSTTLLKRAGVSHAELGGQLVVLASDAGAYTTGSSILIDGGLTAKLV